MPRRKIKNRLLELIQARERKINRRIKQKEIAEFAGVTEHTIMAWLRNKIVRFDAKVIERLCDYLDCEISDLLYFEVTYEDYIPEDPDQMDS